MKECDLLNLIFGEYEPPYVNNDNCYKIYILPLFLTLVFVLFIIIYKNRIFKDVSSNEYVIIFMLSLLFFIISIIANTWQNKKN